MRLPTSVYIISGKTNYVKPLSFKINISYQQLKPKIQRNMHCLKNTDTKLQSSIFDEIFSSEF